MKWWGKFKRPGPFCFLYENSADINEEVEKRIMLLIVCAAVATMSAISFQLIPICEGVSVGN